MSISAFELFSIGVGPSSSHTVGPMRAARAFACSLQTTDELLATQEITVELFGSLALTGVGHGTDVAVLSGLCGAEPQTVDPLSLPQRLADIRDQKILTLLGIHPVPFILKDHLIFHRDKILPKHSNGLRFTAYDAQKNILQQQIYYSIGGGFIVTDEEFGKEKQEVNLPFPFRTAAQLFDHCRTQNISIDALMMKNELMWRSEEAIYQGLLEIAHIMQGCVERGCQTDGILPGGLNVKRRASDLYKKLMLQGKPLRSQRPDAMLWPTVFAMAVNEENAAGGRVVTAPTNGAAGIIPSVLLYYREFHSDASDEKVVQFLLVAAAIGILYKLGASISGAEVGCQGEVGVACSMAAGALTAILGGTLEQIENAAEMAMEHHLGMTCDPVGGLVQIPCIERNGVAAEKAIRLSYLALLEDGKDKKISLDKVIATMLQTGKDMMSIYKETSLGGLASNITEC